MKADGNYPLVEQSARGLGVRTTGPYADVLPDVEGFVEPVGGMSVAPDDPLLLDQHRRPPAYGGTGDDPVWVIQSDQLPQSLAFVRDTVTHGVIAPAGRTTLSTYQADLASTQPDWIQLP